MAFRIDPNRVKDFNDAYYDSIGGQTQTRQAEYIGTGKDGRDVVRKTPAETTYYAPPTSRDAAGNVVYNDLAARMNAEHIAGGGGTQALYNRDIFNSDMARSNANFQSDMIKDLAEWGSDSFFANYKKITNFSTRQANKQSRKSFDFASRNFPEYDIKFNPKV